MSLIYEGKEVLEKMFEYFHVYLEIEEFYVELHRRRMYPQIEDVLLCCVAGKGWQKKEISISLYEFFDFNKLNMKPDEIDIEEWAKLELKLNAGRRYKVDGLGRWKEV